MTASRPPEPLPPEDRPVLAILLILGSMFVFTAMDGIAKWLVGSLHAVQIVWGRYFFVVLFLVPLVLARLGERPLTTRLPWLQAARGVCLVGSSLLFVFALDTLPLALATAISFASPLYVTALSIPMLGETVGVRRWAAVAVGFLGMLIIIRPGTEAFTPAMLLPLASSFCWAFALIFTRQMRALDGPLTTLVWSALVGFVAISAVVPLYWRPLDTLAWGLFATIGACHVAGQYLLIRAFSLASASILAPFSYSTIVWSTLIGVAVFGSFPDGFAWLGTAIVIASGVYVWHRERVRTRPPTVTGASISAAADGAPEKT